MKTSVREVLRHPVLFIEVSWCLLLVELGLRFTSVQKIARWISRKQSSRKLQSAKLAQAFRFAGIVERRVLQDPSCLRASLACFLWSGPGARFSIGVRKGGAGGVEAHAWLAWDGKVVSGAQDFESYQEIYGLNRLARSSPSLSSPN